jgi:drug/metabolite transporter (DMT)-like permease
MVTPRKVYIFLAAGLLCLSQSANIIRLGDANPVAISFWRLFIATLLFVPLAGKGLSALARLTRMDLAVLVLSGFALTAHFFSWIWAVQSTTVANATLFLCINPVITAMAAYLLFGERAGRRLILAIALGMVGVGVLGFSDLEFSPDHLFGDGLALLSSFLFTVYFMAAKRLRKILDAQVYVTAVYGVAAIFSFVALFALDLPLVDYSLRTWVCFCLMALVPTMIGHTSLNTALRYMSAGRISALILVEPLLAGLVASLAWGEAITSATLAGYVLICGSVLMVATERGKGADFRLKRH